MKVTTFITNPNSSNKINALLKSFSFFSTIEIIKEKNEFKKARLQDFVIIEADNFSDQEINDLMIKFENKIIALTNDPNIYKVSLTNFQDCFFSSNFKIIELSSKISDLLSVESNKVEYVPIEINNFYKNGILPCDIFLKLGAQKFIRIAYENDNITIDFLKKYQEKKIDFFYIKNNDFKLHGNTIFSERLIDSSLYQNKVEELSKKTELLHEILSNFGVNKFILKQVDESIIELEKMLKRSNSEIFELFEKSKGSFLHDHGYLTVCFANIILKELDWKSEIIRSKIMMAAMFHDLGITDPKLAMSEALGKSEILTLESKSKEMLLNHCDKIATILHRDALVPDDVVNMCLNHHEGIEQGYPKSKSSASLSQLECLFIIAHATAIGLYKRAFNIKKFPIIIEEITTAYNKGNFRPIITALQSAIEKGEIGGH